MLNSIVMNGLVPRLVLGLAISLVPRLANIASASSDLHVKSPEFVESDIEVLHRFEGEQIGDYFGWVASEIGDVDQDGIKDLLIPAIAEDNFSGRVRLYSGASKKVLQELSGQPGHALGYSVGPAGDVNGDGVADYIIGGGQVLVYSGDSLKLWLDLSATTGFAHSVHGAGDVNCDGYEDIIVGSQSNSVAMEQAGRVFMISGWDGSIIWAREGTEPQQFFGSAVGRIGDLNHDGIDDVVVGAFGAGEFAGGEAYLLSGTDGTPIRRLEPSDPQSASVFGQFFASGAGDIDRDGTPDIFVADYNAGQDEQVGTGRAFIFSGKTGRILHDISGVHSGDGMGPGRGVPDVNGDDYDDILVAAYTNSDGAEQAGKVYLYSGRSGALLRTITARLAGDNFGVDALAVGDTNGDKRGDFLVTSVGLSFANIAPGRAYLIAGNTLPCTSDVDGDGRVNFIDLWIVASQLGRSSPTVDLNGDEKCDTKDIKIVIRDFGHCPKGW